MSPFHLILQHLRLFPILAMFLSFFQSSEMWATGLKSVTMTIRADKFCFKGNFYVSVVVLPDDGECRRHKKFADECIMDKGKNLDK